MDLMEFEEESYSRPVRNKTSKKIYVAGTQFQKKPKTEPVALGVMDCIYRQERCQVIQYSDGSYKVGIDVARLLDKHDFPSFDVRKFRTFAEFSYYCTLLPASTTKAWYMPNRDETEEK